uniref:Uncharacterized protein n=1 Tax=Leersia perrieri TaxID=77586 RepID=A0A0D9WDP1_9ORYZ
MGLALPRLLSNATHRNSFLASLAGRCLFRGLTALANHRRFPAPVSPPHVDITIHWRQGCNYFPTPLITAISLCHSSSEGPQLLPHAASPRSLSLPVP